MIDIRTGQGFDVHAFCEGDQVILGGVHIPFEKSLLGHSDADVLLHAITDALFGAIAEGDIGSWFPPSEAAWKAANSDIFLKKAVERVKARGFRIANIDATLICERPKLRLYHEKICQSIARIIELDIDRVSVKATTSEQLGFTGREEGIAALAVATIIKVEHDNAR